MKVKEIIQELNLTLVTDDSSIDNEVTGGFVGDLLSIVMGKAKEGQIWVTIQGHLNIVAVASLVNVSCIVVAEGSEITEDTIAKANEEGIPILSTNKSSFDIIRDLISIGV